jgi:Zn-finger nucleic acid-binding protein
MTAWEHLRGPAPPRQPLAAERVRYLPCAECRQLMVRRNFGGASGVILDVCGRHGLWFDHGETEKVLEFVRGGGLAREKSRELEQAARRARELRESSSPMRAGGSFGGLLAADAGGGLAGFLIDVLFSD